MRGQELLEQIAEPLVAEHDPLGPGTMMGSACLRYGDRFVAMVERKSGHLVLRLPEGRVRELVDEGAGQPFAPNGKTFREWVAIPEGDDDRWRVILAEAVERAALAEAAEVNDE